MQHLPQRERLRDSLKLARDFYRMGLAMNDLGDLAGAAALLREALSIQRELHPGGGGGGHPALALSLAALGGVMIDSGDMEQAEDLLRDSLEILQRELWDHDPHAAQVASMLGGCLVARGHFKEAEKHLRWCEPILNATFGADAPQTVATLHILSKLYDAWNKPRLAAKYRNMLTDSAPTAHVPTLGLSQSTGQHLFN